MSRPSAQPRGWTRRCAVAVMLAGLFALINPAPAPAAAHIAGTGGSPSNYRTEVTGIRPAVPTMTVTVGLGGQWVRVTNQGAAGIVIPGYRGEPFLRLSQNRVQVNELSTTVAETGLTPNVPASQDLTSQEPAAREPAPRDPAAEPRWVDLSEGDSATWTDARIEAPADPGAASESWQLPVVVDGQQVTVVGIRDRVVPPSPWPWVAALVLLTAGVAAIGWMRNWHRPMAAVVTVGVSAFVLHLLGTGFAPQQSGQLVGWVGVGSVVAFTLVVGVVAVVSTVRRSEPAAVRVIMAATVIVLLAATDITVLWYSQLPFAGPAILDRGLTVLTYAAALGMFIAGMRLSRAAEAGATQPDATESGRASS